MTNNNFALEIYYRFNVILSKNLTTVHWLITPVLTPHPNPLPQGKNE